LARESLLTAAGSGSDLLLLHAEEEMAAMLTISKAGSTKNFLLLLTVLELKKVGLLKIRKKIYTNMLLPE
jgi:hypothetical protein